MRPTLVVIVALAATMTSCQSLTQALTDLSSSLEQTLNTDERQGSKPQTGDAAPQTSPAQPRETSPQPVLLHPASPQWQERIIDTARDATYLNETERRVILPINMARTDPPAYAETVLVPLRSRYHGRLLQYPGEVAIETQEGTDALDECIRVLESTRPLPPLYPKEGLSRAAQDQAIDQARTGALGHEGSDGSSPGTRVSRYGHWDTALGENIDYGNAQAERIVTSLLIDDGVPSRGHRKNLLSPAFEYIGVAVGPHPVYRRMCVLDFAGTFE